MTVGTIGKKDHHAEGVHPHIKHPCFELHDSNYTKVDPLQTFGVYALMPQAFSLPWKVHTPTMRTNHVHFLVDEEYIYA